MLENAKRIYIIGSVGSGKTTFAKKLSIEKGIKHYELDELVWKRNNPVDIKRTDKEINLLFTNVIKKVVGLLRILVVKDLEKELIMLILLFS